jgi:hypothetical protein
MIQSKHKNQNKGITWIKRIIFLSISIVIFLILIMRKIIFKRLSYADFTPFGQGIDSFYRFFFMWDGSFAGAMNQGSFYLFFRSLFEFIFIEPVISQLFFLCTLFFIGYIGFYFVLKKFKIKNFLLYFLPFTYILNSLTLSELTGGAISSLILYFFMPLLFLLTYDLLRSYDLKKGMAFSALIFIYLINIQLFFWITISLFLPIIIIFLLKKKTSFKNLLWLCIHGIIGMLLGIIYILQLINIGNNFSNLNYLSTFKYTYSETFFVNLFRGIGNAGANQNILGYFNHFDPINLMLFIFPIIIISGIFYIKHFGKEKEIFYSLLITFLALIGLLVSIRKGAFDYFIANKNILLVSIRNPQKIFYPLTFSFWLLSSLSINLFFNNIKRSKRKLVFLATLSIFVLLTITPFFNGDFALDKSRGGENYFITNKYSELNNFMRLNGENGFALYLPFDFSLQQKIFWEENIVKLKFGGKMVIGESSEDKILEIYKNLCSGELNSSNYRDLQIRYIIIDKKPKTYSSYSEKTCQTFTVYGTPYIWGETDFFKKVLEQYYLKETENFIYYDLHTKQFPKVNSNAYQKINPTKYVIHLSNIEKIQNLSFLESYHEDWKLYLVKNPSSKKCNQIRFYNNTNTIECEPILKLFGGEEFSYLWKKPIFDETHIKIYDYANQWTINPQYIKDNYPPDHYTENSKGDIDIELILYYKPQSYFYLGLIISGITLISCLAYLIYDWKKNKKERINLEI